MTIEKIFNDLKNLNDSNYRFHLAKSSDGVQPVNVLARSREEWKRWQVYKNRGNGERFPSPVKYIFSFVQLSGNEFIFGGIFEILDRSGEKYKVEYADDYKELIGRIVLTYSGKNGRGTVFTPSYILANSEITEIYKTEYKGEKFPGLENINHKYEDLKLIYDNKLQDWKNVLSNIQGIYLLSDMATGKHYVGSAKGKGGVYGRWNNYIDNLHGGNKELIKLINEKGKDYFKTNFKFTLLETIGMSITEETIEARESIWKDKLLTRGDFGYNAN